MPKHHTHFGDEALIEELLAMGRLEEMKKRGAEPTQDDLDGTAANGAKM